MNLVYVVHNRSLIEARSASLLISFSNRPVAGSGRTHDQLKQTRTFNLENYTLYIPSQTTY